MCFHHHSFSSLLYTFSLLCIWCYIISCFHSSEENVWKLCEQVKKQNPNELSKCYAVFVSNERRTVPLWRQKAGRGEDKLVVWVSHYFFSSIPVLQPQQIYPFFPFFVRLWVVKASWHSRKKFSLVASRNCLECKHLSASYHFESD